VVADHLSRISNAPIIQAPINEDFPDEHILALFQGTMVCEHSQLPGH